MGFLDRIFGRKSGEAEGVHAEAVLEQEECPHVNLVPQWDDADDIGHEDRASRFLCGTCRSDFSPEEAQHLRETEAERIGATEA